MNEKDKEKDISVTPRPIKFRAKEVDTGKWVYGSLINTVGADKRPLIHVSPEEGEKIVDPATIGQFVCTHEGTDVYEGDLIEGRDGHEHSDGVWTIMWWERMVSFVLANGSQDVEKAAKETLELRKSDKVIGNAHDNPELLEA